MSTPNPVLVARSQIANAVRAKASPQRLKELRQGLTTAKVERAIRSALADEHPPTTEQRHLLAALLTGGDA